MNEITQVGVDLAKRVIQVHAVDAAGRVVAAKPLSADKFAAWCALEFTGQTGSRQARLTLCRAHGGDGGE